MPKYIVSVREVHVQQIEVEASSEAEALGKVGAGEGMAIDNTLEYSHTLDPSTWTVTEEIFDGGG